MSIRRRSTVHDFASLRLHTDGSRVQQPRSQRQAVPDSNNEKPRVAKNTVLDSQGNQFARDAGGSGIVKKLRRESKRRINEQDDADHERGEEASLAEGLEEVDGERSSNFNDKEKVLKDTRAKKRRKFHHDFEFLAQSPKISKSESFGRVPSAQDSETSTSGRWVSEPPSSDLLKCIHHFASEFYSGKGLLYDAPKAARKEKKARKLAWLRKVERSYPNEDDGEESASDDGEGSDEETDDTMDDGVRGAEDGGGRSDNAEQATEDESVNGRTKKEKKKKTKAKTGLQRDMYKVFDGSALMAIGMLLQEHVISLLKSDIPDGWEDEMVEQEEAYFSEGLQDKSETKPLSQGDANDKETRPQRGSGQTSDNTDSSSDDNTGADS